MFCLPVPHICERFIYFQDWSAYSAAGKYVDKSWHIYLYIAHRHMNVESGTAAAQFLEKEYINGILLAVYNKNPSLNDVRCMLYFAF